MASLVYWLISFAQKEPLPRTLPDHAHHVLAGVATTAREHRATLERRLP